MMRIGVVIVLIATLLVAARFPGCVAFPSTAPAFLWSPHYNDGMREAVNYQTISPKDLAKVVLSEGGWSNLLCPGKKIQQSADLALVFVGKELQSSDVSSNKHADPSLVNTLKASFTRSNFSMAFPYVASSDEETTENSLVSGFTETCGNDLGMNNVAFLESCSVEGENFQKLTDLHSVRNYLVSRTQKSPEGQADLVVFCSGGSPAKEFNQPRSESEIFTELISAVEHSGVKYQILYVSDPFRSIHYPSYRDLSRFLTESTSGNLSANSTTCDGVCQLKSSLLEGLFVGLVLLIILISGLCCMMGIDTPTRFEAPQES